MADTNTAGPNTPVAVLDSEADVSLVPLIRALIKLPRRGSEEAVVEEEDFVKSWLDEVSVVVSFANCLLKCCRAAIRAWARCRWRFGRMPSAFTWCADSNASSRQTESKG